MKSGEVLLIELTKVLIYYWNINSLVNSGNSLSYSIYFSRSLFNFNLIHILKLYLVY